MNQWPYVSASKLVADAILDYWGERCPDHDPDCNTCKAWSWYDSALNRSGAGTSLTPIRHGETRK